MDGIAVNSPFVAERVQRFWNVDAEVIYPPVDTTAIRATARWDEHVSESERFILDALPETFVLGASRWVPYKGMLDVIRFGEAVQLPVVLAGGGPQEAQLRAAASNSAVPVTFIVRPSNSVLYALYQRALAYIFPPVEDFGIMPVEAMAAGARVIVNVLGGAAGSVVHGESGVHVDSFDGATARLALDSAELLDGEAARLRSTEFSRERFVQRTREWVL